MNLRLVRKSCLNINVWVLWCVWCSKYESLHCKNDPDEYVNIAV